MAEAQAQNNQILQLLLLVNRLQLTAFRAPNAETLGFIIVNDTHQIFKYNRAFLYSFDHKPPRLIAISGQHKVNKETEFYQKSNRLISHLINPSEPQLVTAESFEKEKDVFNEIFPHGNQLKYWLPIKIDDKLRLGLWLEVTPPVNQKERNPQEELNFLVNTLAPGYGAAWQKFDRSKKIKPFLKSKYFWIPTLLVTALLLVLIQVPLRIIAPVEIIPKKPVIITAPLEGVVNEIKVKPGQEVKKGDLLFEYDKRLPLQELKTAEEQVEIAKAEYDRASTLGLSDSKALAEVELLRLKLAKEESTLELAKIQASKLEVKAALSGVVTIDYPEEWSGKPVRVGEKIMTLSDPSQTKVRIWIPENDNIVIDPAKPLHIILNTDPDKRLYADLEYISFESRIGEGEVPAFVAEAAWEEGTPEVKLGLKGTAVIYGDEVPLIYFIIRKPLASFRRITGL